MWLPLFLAEAQADSVIEFKASAPVALFVDGKQATLTGELRQRVGGLAAGVHTVQINGVFGKTLYEAEIDLPDNTLTTTSWDRGDLRVVKTEWLPEDGEQTDVAEADEGADEGAGVVVVPEPPPEVVDVVPPAPPVVDEVPVVPPPVVAPVAGPIAVPKEPAPPVKQATAMPSALKPRTLTVQATDGMKIEVVHAGRTLRVVVDGDTFRIEDPTGAVLALGSE